MGIIYKCTNLINNKKYIGQTIHSLQNRKTEHYGYCLYDGTVFHNAILKYGKENFKWEILGEYPNEELDKWEQFWIKKEDTFFKNGKGYNMNFGGNTAIGREINKKRVKSYKVDTFGNLLEGEIFNSLTEASEILSKRTGKNISTTMISKICKRDKGYHSCCGYTFNFVDDEDKEISNFHSSKAKVIKIIQPDGTSDLFPSINSAHKALGINPRVIKNALDRGGLIVRGQFKNWKVEEISNWNRIVTDKEKSQWQLQEHLKKYNIDLFLEGKKKGVKDILVEIVKNIDKISEKDAYEIIVNMSGQYFSEDSIFQNQSEQ